MAAYPEYKGICHAWAFSLLPVGMVTRAWAVEHNEVAFLDVSVTFPCFCYVSMMSNNANNLMPGH